MNSKLNIFFVSQLFFFQCPGIRSVVGQWLITTLVGDQYTAGLMWTRHHRFLTLPPLIVQVDIHQTITASTSTCADGRLLQSSVSLHSWTNLRVVGYHTLCNIQHKKYSFLKKPNLIFDQTFEVVPKVALVDQFRPQHTIKNSATFLWRCMIIFSTVLICWSMIMVIRIKKSNVTHVQLKVKSWKWFSCSTCQPSFCQNNFSLELFARWHFPGLHYRQTLSYLVQIWGGKTELFRLISQQQWFITKSGTEAKDNCFDNSFCKLVKMCTNMKKIISFRRRFFRVINCIWKVSDINSISIFATCDLRC